MNIASKTLSVLDTPETLLVVSLYPKRGETYSSGTTGVASYTKNLVTNMDRSVAVLADVRTSTDKTSHYQENNTHVFRCFTPGKSIMWLQLLHTISQFTQAKTVLIQFDFSMYGSMITSGLLLPFIALLRARGYTVSVVSHHVVTDVKKLKGHMGLTNSLFDQVTAWFYNILFKVFYFSLSLVSSSIIVLEETLQKALQSQLPKNNVVAIPHAVDTSLKPIAKATARRKLGLKQDEHVVMFFGFVNWFKGADEFVSMFKSVDMLNGKPVRFVLAGGESSTLKQKKYYQKFYEHVLQEIDQSHRVQITGYVPQNKIQDYFSAADLVIFPYRTFMCASGVMSLTFSYKRPFIISEPLAEMLEAPDFLAACDEVGLAAEDITFRLTHQDGITVTEKVLHNGLKPKLRKMCAVMRDRRSFKNNAQLYEEALFATQPAQSARTAYEIFFQK